MQTAEKTVAFYTLGCKLNFSETSTIARQFKEEGFSRVEFDERAADVKQEGVGAERDAWKSL